MRSNEKLALIIPTLGEAQCLPLLLERVRSLLAASAVPFEILVVDDDSRDGTEQIVRAIAAEDSRVRLLVRHGERGLAGAILYGWQHTDASILGVMDADLQHPPEVLASLIAAIENGCDLAIASRYAPGAAAPDQSVLRRAVSRASTWVTRPLQPAGLRVRDPLSGFFIVRRHCVENILFRPTGFKLLLEVLVRGRVRSVEEIPFTFRSRAAGHSKAGLRIAWDYAQLLVQLYRTRLLAVPLADVPADAPADASAD
jgi:dolichol-phosphate mannosyltransferase